MKVVEIYELSNILTTVLGASIVSGVLIAFIPWALGMVVTAFKHIIQKI